MSVRGTGAATRPVRAAAAAGPGGGPDWEWAAPAPSAPRAGGSRPPSPTERAASGLPFGRRLWSLLPLMAAAGAAGCGFHRVFAAGDLLPVVAVAVVAPVALSVLVSGVWSAGARSRGALAALWPSVLLTVVAWVVVACATLFRRVSGGLPAPQAVRAAWSALLDAPHTILATILPAPGVPALLVLPSAVLWAASFLAAELALRTRAPLLPVLPVVAAFGVPLVLGVDGPGSQLPVLAALVACAAALVLVRGRVAPSWRSLPAALPIVVVLTVAGGLLAPHLPGMPAPYDPRDAVTPPTARPRTTSPLDEVAVWMRQGAAPVFTVRVHGGDGQQNYRLAVLDSYDGVSWSHHAPLARSGGRVPPEKAADPGGTAAITQTFTIASLPGLWLPAADRPTRVALPSADDDLFVDQRSGELVLGGRDVTGEGGVRSGFRYTATSLLPVYDVRRLQYAPAADDPAMTVLPRTDPAGRPIPAVATFTRTAAAATAGSSFPYEQAVRLADWLRAGHHFDPRALPGHSYRQLEFFLTTGKRGTSEQFAASFAVMARTLGLPSRVVVGFRHGTPAGDGTWQVRGQDVLAWPEVEFKGIGWVPFYPTPDAASASGSSVAPAGQPTERRQADQQISRQTRSATPPHRAPAHRATAVPGPAGLPWWAWAPVAVVVLALLYALYAAWLPWRRRARRRGDPDPGRRVLGAWQQIVERLTEIGLPATGAHTAAEVAAFGAARVGGAAGEHLPALADLVNQVGYAGRTPDAASATAAWQHCDAVERVVLRSVPRRERLRRGLRPAALRRAGRGVDRG